MYNVRGGGLCQISPQQVAMRYNSVSMAITNEEKSAPRVYDPLYGELNWLRRQEW